MTKLFDAAGQPTQAYWDRYSAIAVALRDANLQHPMSADLHAYTRMEGRSVADVVADWGSSRLNRK